jgi:anti-anti-sigma regulatory factor
MDRRWSRRIHQSLHVDLSCHDRLLGRYPTRNLSFEGMFVETGLLGLHRDDAVGLALQAGDGTIHMGGQVAYQSSEGVGIALADPSPEYCRIVRAALGRRESSVESVGGGAPGSPTVANRGHAIEIIEIRAATAQFPAAMALRLQVGEQLDVSACPQIYEARRILSSAVLDRIVVDLAATRRVLDSGLALLLVLRERAGRLRDHIYLANCRPEVRSRLTGAGLESQFCVG